MPFRRRPRRLPLLVAPVLLGALASAASAATLVIPGLARAPGKNGTRFESTLWVTNRSAEGARFTVDWIPLPPGSAAQASLWLGPGESTRVDDAVLSLFGIAEGAGAVAITALPLFDARGVTSNVADPRGLFGGAPPTVDRMDALAAGETAHLPWVSESADRSRGERTNVGLVLLEPGTTVDVVARDAAGLETGRRRVVAAAPSSAQLSWSTLAPAAATARGEVVVVAGRAIGYCSVVDNVTGDAVVVPATRLRGDATDRWVAGVARAPGRDGTRWSADLRVVHPGSGTATVRLEAVGIPGVDRAIERAVPAGATLALDDLLGPTGLDLPDGSAGALRVRSAAPLVVAARVANRPGGGDGGGFSSLLPSADAPRFVGANRTAAVPGLRQDAVARTNLALLGGEGGGSGRLSLVDPAGRVVAAAPFAVGAGEWLQRPLPDLLGTTGMPAGSRLELAVDAGSVLPAVSVVEARSGDPAVLPAGRWRVGAGTLAGTHLAGYQGWFAAPGDGSPANRWLHWFDDDRPSCDALSVDLWPDLSEYDADERFDTGLSTRDGRPAEVFSSWNPKTVDRHLFWMERADLDGVLLQRFLSELDEPELAAFRDGVLQRVRASAAGRGRSWALVYDLSSHHGVDLPGAVMADWLDLVNRLRLADDPSYLRHRGRPLVGLWGVGFANRPGTPQEIAALVDFFHGAADPAARATVLAGVPALWRTLAGQSKTDPAWAAVYRSFDVVSPWHVGQARTEGEIPSFVSRLVAPDLAECDARGIDYLPVLFPGFSWHNLTGAPLDEIPRNGGSFYRSLGSAVLAAGARQVETAMFDEVDEGTAILEIAPSADLPLGCPLVPLDAGGVATPSDRWLDLAGEIGRKVRSSGR